MFLSLLELSEPLFELVSLLKHIFVGLFEGCSLLHQFLSLLRVLDLHQFELFLQLLVLTLQELFFIRCECVLLLQCFQFCRKGLQFLLQPHYILLVLLLLGGPGVAHLQQLAVKPFLHFSQ